MIVWLDVPESQEKSAKRKGAQLSLETGRWFVKDAENLTPFMQWIPRRVTAPTTATELNPALGEGWSDPRETTISRKGRRVVKGVSGNPYAGNLPTFTGKLKGNI
ncbi:hypothetical protein FHX57_006765 [Paraburkholderia tropica]|uniref:DUF5710 domain-containing protein n=1 Tax=Paraburkholderia tropica TaxID=92647 RepID=UPI0016141656|nr:DUF5710 domain-containing protein [Paraburkholderia tropica]MBB3004383.1 hypothetical protein [Paraburkholderia tropica]